MCSTQRTRGLCECTDDARRVEHPPARPRRALCSARPQRLPTSVRPIPSTKQRRRWDVGIQSAQRAGIGQRSEDHSHIPDVSTQMDSGVAIPSAEGPPGSQRGCAIAYSSPAVESWRKHDGGRGNVRRCGRSRRCDPNAPGSYSSEIATGWVARALKDEWIEVYTTCIGYP